MTANFAAPDGALNSLVIGLWYGLSIEIFGEHDRRWNELMLSGACGLASGFATHALGRRPDSPDPVVFEGRSSAVTMLMATIMNDAPEAHWDIIRTLTDEQVSASTVEVVSIAAVLAWRSLGAEKLPSLIGHLCEKIPGLPDGFVEATSRVIVARWSK